MSDPERVDLLIRAATEQFEAAHQEDPRSTTDAAEAVPSVRRAVDQPDACNVPQLRLPD